MPATISSTFAIEFTQAAGTTTGTIITNPGRAFRVLAAYATGLNNAAITVKKNTNSGATACGPTTLATGDLNDFPLTIVEAEAGFSASDNVCVIVATANATKVTLLCIAEGGGQGLTVTAP